VRFGNSTSGSTGSSTHTRTRFASSGDAGDTPGATGGTHKSLADKRSSMTDIELILLGVALGAVPTSNLARLVVAALGKRLGVAPREIENYNAATDNDDDTRVADTPDSDPRGQA